MSPVDFRLYLITDRQQCRNRTLEQTVEEACETGVKALQLREKDLAAADLFKLAKKLKRICDKTGTKLFINDRFDLTEAVNGDGVQLTSQSLPVDVVKKHFSKNKLIGVSTHSLEEAYEAEQKEADFILFGPIFTTPSKVAFGEPQGLIRLKQVTHKIDIPVFAVGGINPDNAIECLENGAHGVAVISSIITAHNIKNTIRRFKNSLGNL